MERADSCNLSNLVSSATQAINKGVSLAGAVPTDIDGDTREIYVLNIENFLGFQKLKEDSSNR